MVTKNGNPPVEVIEGRDQLLEFKYGNKVEFIIDLDNLYTRDSLTFDFVSKSATFRLMERDSKTGTWEVRATMRVEGKVVKRPDVLIELSSCSAEWTNLKGEHMSECDLSPIIVKSHYYRDFDVSVETEEGMDEFCDFRWRITSNYSGEIESGQETSTVSYLIQTDSPDVGSW